MQKIQYRKYHLHIYIILILSFCYCDFNKTDNRFTLISAKDTGIDFTNIVKDDTKLNIFTYLYFYNGGGVAVGDLNGDNLLDIFFTANQGENKLYLNKGSLRFEDITKHTQTQGNYDWSTGVTMVDINHDGRLDIYVCNLGEYMHLRGKNELYINKGNDENGIPIFQEAANDYGLDLVGFATQASFLDYDSDGDLDMFLLNHSVHDNGTFGKSSSLRHQHHPLAGDVLMRNDDGFFVNVSQEVGIYTSALGYGLGVNTADINLDGYPDIYVGNDFHEDDYLYINNGDGTFTEKGKQMMPHTSRFSMGNDIADFNNDGLPDILSIDMLPKDPYILKASATEDPYDIYNFKLNFGYSHQYARNTLQYNRGDSLFSDIGLLSGVAASDWSWSGLFMDFDNDGFKDIFIANGILRRSNDLDYINFISDEVVQLRIRGDIQESDLDLINVMPTIEVPNGFYHNQGNLHFQNVSTSWTTGTSSYSHGAAYGDLDNDGDLDIVVNNTNKPAFIYRNQTQESNANYIRIKLQGDTKNKFGIGTKVWVTTKQKRQYQEVIATRGYQSSVDTRLTFGIGDALKIDTLLVVWPNGKYQYITNMAPNSEYTLNYADASGVFDYNTLSNQNYKPFLKNITQEVAVPYVHKENKFVEFTRQSLIPHMMSTEGPRIAVSDVNNDGLDDIFVGGAKWQAASLFTQDNSGNMILTNQHVFQDHSLAEDIDVEFFDADGDNDMDLLVLGGGNEFPLKHEANQVRLYMNDGGGNFTWSNDFPNIYVTGSVIAVNDYDKDGDEDIFIGGRAIPWHYGIVPQSYLIQNMGDGVFEIVTPTLAPELEKIGFVTDAVWTDVNNDDYIDLVVVGEWMPIHIFKGDGSGKLRMQSLQESGFEQSEGWWNSIEIADVDNDGDIDLILGNLGLNSKLKASLNQPVRMYVNDFDDNKSSDVIITHYMDDKEYIFATKDELATQLEEVKRKYVRYHDYARADLDDIISLTKWHNSQIFEVYTFYSAIAINENGKFNMMPLPAESQFSPIRATLTHDLNHDGILDMIVVGNFYESNIQRGRYDASYGLVMMGDKEKYFVPMPHSTSELSIKGPARDIDTFTYKGKKGFIVSINNDALQFFQYNNQK